MMERNNQPPSTPPPPHLPPVVRPKNWRAGLYSQWIALAGLILLLGIIFYHNVFYMAGARFQETPLYESVVGGVMTVLLFAQFAAFSLGVVAARLREGKIGLAVSSVALLLLAYLTSLSG